MTTSWLRVVVKETINSFTEEFEYSLRLCLWRILYPPSRLKMIGFLLCSASAHSQTMIVVIWYKQDTGYRIQKSPSKRLSCNLVGDFLSDHFHQACKYLGKLKYPHITLGFKQLTLWKDSIHKNSYCMLYCKSLLQKCSDLTLHIFRQSCPLYISSCYPSLPRGTV